MCEHYWKKPIVLVTPSETAEYKLILTANLSQICENCGECKVTQVDVCKFHDWTLPQKASHNYIQNIQEKIQEMLNK